jgi:hypothetical protein
VFGPALAAKKGGLDDEAAPPLARHGAPEEAGRVPEAYEDLAEDVVRERGHRF